MTLRNDFHVFGLRKKCFYLDEFLDLPRLKKRIRIRSGVDPERQKVICSETKNKNRLTNRCLPSVSYYGPHVFVVVLTTSLAGLQSIVTALTYADDKTEVLDSLLSMPTHNKGSCK